MGKRDAEAARLGLLVRSGLYEVDLLLRLMTPGYWPEAQHRVLRGTWFVEKGHDWVPLKETVCRRKSVLWTVSVMVSLQTFGGGSQDPLGGRPAGVTLALL